MAFQVDRNADSATPNKRAATMRSGTSTVSAIRSEEHTSELQSRLHLVCRLLLETKKHTSELQSRLHLVCRLLLEKKKCISLARRSWPSLYLDCPTVVTRRICPSFAAPQPTHRCT